jgi:aldehyde:ferredoxin oxidoreductase
MPYGYHGKILHVDLADGRIEVESPPESFYRTYMGGSAMGVNYVLRGVPKGADPLGPENILTIFDSVVTGASISGQSRICVNAKSPMSGAIGDSQAGGFFPAEFKFAGYDGLVLRGISPQWVYLTIIDGKAELHDASHLLGKVTGEVDALLKQEVGDSRAQVMQVGPAAEKGVRFSAIVNMANRMNGRTGMGLVMASKRLKAVVVRGKAKPPVADQKAMVALNRRGPDGVKANPDMDGLAKFGTAVVVLYNNMIGTLPTRNFTEGQFEGADPISGEKMAETILKSRDTCYACVVKCKRVVEITEGRYKFDPLYGGPEYETIALLGSSCGINDLAVIAQAHQVCDMNGVDTITCGGTIAFAMECYEKGIIGKEETDGIDLRFGDADALLDALNRIVTRTGKLGAVLSEGSARAARIWGNGAEKLLTTVKNEEAPAHMPQAKRSLALIYSVNPFGADHQSSEHDPYYEEGVADLNLNYLKEIGLGTPQAPGSLGPEKVRFAYLSEAFYSMMDTLTLCQFVYGPAWCLYGPKDTAEMVRSVTGWDVTVDELLTIGKRRISLMRTFNAREGFGRKDDRLPDRLHEALVGTGPTAGIAVPREQLDAALDEYYRLAGFTNDGIPTRETLKSLDIEWAADYLPV